MPSDVHATQIDDEALEWFVRLSGGSVDDTVRADFATWRLADAAHARAYDELAGLWADLDGVAAPGATSSAGKAKASPDPARRSASVSPRPWRLAANSAAALLVAAAGYGVYAAAAPPGGVPALLADVRTAPGETRALTLPDGTRVRLAGASALDYRISARERRVRMIAGHAFFEISPEKQRAFRVVTDTADIRDIGTAFEVATSGAQSRVAVAEGIVEVTLDGGRAATVRAGQSVAFGKTLAPIAAIAPANVAAWRSNRMVFDDASLRSVLAELESYGAGRIVLLDRGLGERRLTGAFDTRRPREALDAIARITGARVTRVGPLSFVRAEPRK